MPWLTGCPSRACNARTRPWSREMPEAFRWQQRASWRRCTETASCYSGMPCTRSMGSQGTRDTLRSSTVALSLNMALARSTDGPSWANSWPPTKPPSHGMAQIRKRLVPGQGFQGGALEDWCQRRTPSLPVSQEKGHALALLRLPQSAR